MSQQVREIRTTARQVNNRRQLTRILLTIVLLLLVLMTSVFACASVLNKAGRFTINLDPDAFNKYGISISSTEDFSNPTIMLEGTALENMWNITQEWLLNSPENKQYYSKDDPTYENYEGLDQEEGSHNGKDYIAYTFWIKNSGTKDGGYYGTLDIDSVAKGADEAMRAMVFRNGVPTVYGKTPKNPDAQYATFGIDEFFTSPTVVTELVRTGFKVGDIDRYTVVIWLEGWDPECVNDIMGGEVKLSMNFKVLEGDAETSG